MGGDAAQTLLDSAIWKRNLITSKRKNFLGNLQSVLLERDITPDKLKNASILRVDIPKLRVQKIDRTHCEEEILGGFSQKKLFNWGSINLG